MKHDSKLSFFSKISTKIALLISAIFLITTGIQILVASSRSSNYMETTYLNYAQNLAEETTIGVDFATKFGEEAYGGYAKNLAEEAAVSINFSRYFGESVYKSYAQDLAEKAVMSINIAIKTGTLNQASLSDILNHIKIKNVDGSYAYMVSPTGTMLWHPTPDKIGKPVENAAVKGIVSELQKGFKIENGSVLYEYHNATKLAGYAFTSDGNILIVTADYNEFMKIDFNTLLGNIKIDNVDGSYAYMVSPTGTMLWHPTFDKIGKPVENAAVKGIVADIQAGKQVMDGYVIYDYKGSRKLAGYSFTNTGNIVLVTADYDKLIVIDYDKLIGNINISGIEGSYAYMVSPNGTMLYHKDKSKIGKPVENAAVKKIVADIQDGRKVTNGSCSYEYKGSYKIAGYAFLKSGNIVIVTADRDKMMASVDEMRYSLIIYGLLGEFFSVFFVYFFIVYMLKALNSLVLVINKTANFDLSKDHDSDRLEKRSDEIGLIARALASTRDNLHDIVEAISSAESSIYGNVDELKLTIDSVENICQDNTSTTEELAAGMQKTATNTTAMTQNAENLKNHVGSIEEIAENGAKTSGEVLARAKDLAVTIDQTSQRTIDLYKSVMAKSERAINASKAVDKINELTATIMSIASQTSVLSLNASIEAARAGEMGRGFSVVAQEIRNMASKISEAVNSISGIVDEVNDAVVQMSDCLGETTQFLESNVLSDYQEFSKVSQQYKDDADTFGNTMNTVKDSIEKLNNEIGYIVNAISDIDTTINESSASIRDIADKSSEMVKGTLGSAGQVSNCKNAVSDMSDLINKFKL